MGAALTHIPSVVHDDAIGGHGLREAVRDDQRGAVLQRAGAAERDLAAGRLVDAGDERGEGRPAGAADADQRDPLTGVELDVDAGRSTSWPGT